MSTESVDSQPTNSKQPIPSFSPPNNLRTAVQYWTGFANVSNFILFLLTAGVFAIFSAFTTLSLKDGLWMKPEPPGEPFWFREGLMKWGMQIHLWSVIPAGLLLPLQFLPVMRRQHISLHRIFGRLLFILLLGGNVTALIIAKHSFGGTITTQIAVMTLASTTTFSTYKAWTSIRNLYIDRHRAWVLRTWSYACAILTLRIFLIIIAIAAAEISPNAYKSVNTCEQIIFMQQYVLEPKARESLYDKYPACANLTTKGGDVFVVVNASLNDDHPEEVAALLNMAFGVAGWLAGVVHILLVEVYLNYTKDEDERLKKVSMARRRAAGLEGSTKVTN